MSHKSARQECSIKVSGKSPTRVSYKSVPQYFSARVSRKVADTNCPTRVSHKSVKHYLCDLDRSCLFAFEYVFAFGFVGSILFRFQHVRDSFPTPGARRSQRCDSTNSCTSERPMRSRIPREESWSCLSKLVINVCLVCAGCFRMLLVLCRSVLLMVEGNMMEPLR